jgi:NADH-quinone oxidoreductase subunit J
MQLPAIPSIPIPTIEQIGFGIMATIVVGAALAVVTLRNIFHSALFLALTFLGAAGTYLFLAADFIAVAQVLVYVGAIMILLMFALMLTHRVMTTHLRQTIGQWRWAAAIALWVLVLIVRLLVLHPWDMDELPSKAPTTATIGMELMTKYVLPFELVSVVLLVAMVGAIILAKEDKPDDPA